MKKKPTKLKVRMMGTDRKMLFLVKCPSCKTKFWRNQESVDKGENCGVCLQDVKMIK